MENPPKQSTDPNASNDAQLNQGYPYITPYNQQQYYNYYNYLYNPYYYPYPYYSYPQNTTPTNQNNPTQYTVPGSNGANTPNPNYYPPQGSNPNYPPPGSNPYPQGSNINYSGSNTYNNYNPGTNIYTSTVTGAPTTYVPKDYPVVNPYNPNTTFQMKIENNSTKRPLSNVGFPNPKRRKVNGIKDLKNLPQSLQNYIERTRSKYDDGDDVVQAMVEAKLKAIINDAKKEHRLESTNWNNYPLPDIPTQQDKKNEDTPPPPPQNNNNKYKYVRSEFTIGLGPNESKSNKNIKKKNSYGEKISHNPLPKDEYKSEQRRNRFKNTPTTTSREVIHTTPKVSEDMGIELNWSNNEIKIVGTCQDLEKQYFRLTSIPDPNTVRPQEVLKQSLKLVRQKWNTEKDYSYVWGQLKSIRQDLLVQGIRNEFTVEVYETNGRLSLENGDFAELSQCLSQLQLLYHLKINGAVMEFTAYRILFALSANDNLGMISILRSLTIEMKNSEVIKHALKVRESVALDDYYAFFVLLKEAPLMSNYLMNRMLNRMRILGLKIIFKCYRPSLEVSWIMKQIGFDNIQTCIEYLLEKNCDLSKNQRVLKTVESLKGLLNWEKQEFEKIKLDMNRGF